MKNWKLSNEVELFDKIEGSSKNVEISYTSDDHNEYVYLVKIKKEDRTRFMINEFEKKMFSMLESNQMQLINEFNQKILDLENRHKNEINQISEQLNLLNNSQLKDEINKLNEQINEKFANFQPQEVDYTPYFKDFNKKIDIISKRLFKLEAEMNLNKLNLKKISTLPEIKKELKFQQKLAKTVSKLN